MAQTCITVQDVMDYGHLDNEALRVRLTLLLASVFAACEQYCCRKFSSDQFTEYFDASGAESSYYVANPPMTALASVTDDAQYGARAINTATNVLWFDAYKERGEVHLYKNEGYFSGGIAGVKVVYTGGYTSATIPADLKEAICQEVLYRLNDRAVGVGNQAADGASVNYNERNGFAAQVCDVLDRYRCHWKGIG
jgi:hypothetical protein